MGQKIITPLTPKKCNLYISMCMIIGQFYGFAEEQISLIFPKVILKQSF